MKGGTMNMTKVKGAPRKRGWLASMALLGLATTPHVWADSILMAQTTLVTNTTSTDDSFVVSSPGTVTVSLQNLDWPTPLSALSFSATSANQVLANWDSATTNQTSDVSTFQVAAGTYFAHIMATAGDPLGLDMGLYSLLVTFKPNTPSVPLPASDWMLLTGMFVLAGIARVVRPFSLTGTAEA